MPRANSRRLNRTAGEVCSETHTTPLAKLQEALSDLLSQVRYSCAQVARVAEMVSSTQTSPPPGNCFWDTSCPCCPARQCPSP